MDYDPVKKDAGRIFNCCKPARVLFYRLLNVLLLRSWHVRREIRRWARTAPGGACVLDAGSGFGQYVWFVSRLRKDFRVKGIDVKEEEVEICNRFFRTAGNGTDPATGGTMAAASGYASGPAPANTPDTAAAPGAVSGVDAGPAPANAPGAASVPAPGNTPDTAAAPGAASGVDAGPAPGNTPAPRVIFEKADLLEFREPGTYNLALCIDVLEHIEDDVRVMSNICRSLKPGGTLIISTPSDQGGSDVHGDGDHSFIGEHVRDGYGREEIAGKLTSAGFSSVETHYTYGRWGSISWRLSMKYPIWLLNRSKIFFLVLPVYYLLTFPVALALNFCDIYTRNRTGTGLLVRAVR
ncbi:MAG: methyltransferase domain-containing protein [Marinilabiliales bacterium]|nr:MAG: methyltransferase domain-containing protein [Marinilabiliales bacterium]